ncbi:MAG: hypothetical protein QOC63_5679 [Mycobacterium sp.]|jgi:hypothetical protein|nr:hypothetical protein [Mycobacterium sp.]
MLFPMMILLIVLSPLFVPVAVTVVHEFSNWRSNQAFPALARPVAAVA